MRFNVYRRAVAADKYFRSRQAALDSTVRVGADVLHVVLLKERSSLDNEAHVV